MMKLLTFLSIGVLALSLSMSTVTTAQNVSARETLNAVITPSGSIGWGGGCGNFC